MKPFFLYKMKLLNHFFSLTSSIFMTMFPIFYIFLFTDESLSDIF